MAEQENGSKRHPKVPAEVRPGFVLPVSFEEIDEFEQRAKRFRIGDEDPTAFQLFRLSRGPYARNMLRNPICQRLPRKFKTAFSCCPHDCAGTPYHDLGFLAKLRDGVKGFEIVVGGGTSTMPRRADTVWEFARVDDGEYIRVAEAILRVFDREGDLPGLLRKNLNKARIKFLLHKIGVDEFRKKVVDELAKEWAKAPIDVAALSEMAPELPSPPVADDGPSTGSGQGKPAADGCERWRRTNTRRQKQEGFCAATVTVPIGNIATFQFRELARIMRKIGRASCRERG